jgi:hypothetical protein
MVLLRYLLERYRMSELYNEAGPDDPVVAEVELSVHGDGRVEANDVTSPDDGTAP